MRTLETLLLACVAVAAIRYTLTLAIIAFTGLLLWGALTYPLETAGFMLLLMAWAMLQLHPWVSLAVAGMGAVVAALRTN